LPPSVLEPLWDHFAALLPHRDDTHPLGCHRPRIPDRVVFDKHIQVLVFGCGYRRIADHFLWSAQDNFEWIDGFGNRFGLVYVDFDTLERKPKLSAEWFQEAARQNARGMTTRTQ
jgi:hypothetical protein